MSESKPPSESAAAEKTYFQKRMELYGITEEINYIEILKHNPELKGNELVKVPIFRETEKGIGILVYTLDRTIIMHEKSGSRYKTQEYMITRLEHPIEDGKGNVKKYDIPKGAGTHPFIPPGLLKKFEAKEEIEVLTLTEGYFKAFKADMHGFDIVGLSSITHYKDKDTGAMHPDVVKIIKTCHVKKVVWLVDGDCLNLSSKAFVEKEGVDPVDLYKRPNQFFSSAKSVKALLDDYQVEKIFAHIISSAHKNDPKGLDDLLIEMKGQETSVLNDFMTFSRPNQYFNKIDMTYSMSNVHSFFHLKNVDDFVQFYSDKYPALHKGQFLWNGTKYLYDSDKNECKIVIPGEAREYFRVGDQYHYKLAIPNKYGLLDNTFHRRQKSTIMDDHGKEFCKHIPKYKAFCVVPDHMNFQEIIHSCYNLYAPFEHEPGEGECPETIEFLKHIFGSGSVKHKHPKTGKYEEVSELDLGLDYLQLLYTQPTQILPILCLVSKEQGTGKTTLGKWLRMIFTQNVAIVGNAELADNFNASWASKLLIICDEAKIDKQVVVEKVKALSTADKIFMNAKGKDHVEIDFFGKFLFMTNNEENFIYASEEDVRYWIRKVPVIQKLNVNLLSDLADEIPAFLNYLTKRKLATDCQHRAWFNPQLIKTEALSKVIAYSQSTLEKEIRSNIRDMFMDFPDLQVIELTKKNIKDEFFKNKNYEMNYIHHVLEEKLKIKMACKYKVEEEVFETLEAFMLAHPDKDPSKHQISPVKRYKYPKWEYHNSNGTLQKMRLEVSDIGRPFQFHVHEFLLPAEIHGRHQSDAELSAVFGPADNGTSAMPF